MRIAVFGLPNQIIHTLDALLQAKHQVAVIIPPTPTHQAHAPVVQYAKLKNIPYLFFNESPLEATFIDKFKTYQPDVAFVCGFDKLIPTELLKIPDKGFINFHPSYLPDYRGGNSYFYMLCNGEQTAGVTAHFMDEHFDTGDIIYQEKYTLSPQETIGTLANKAEQELAIIAVRIANELRAGKTLPRTPQPLGKFKTAQSVIPERGDTRINWHLSAINIERLVRACNPFYGALTSFRGKMLIILQARIDPKPTTDAPGKIIKCTDHELWIATGEGSIIPTVIQYDNYMLSTTDRFIQEIKPLLEESLQ